MIELKDVIEEKYHEYFQKYQKEPKFLILDARSLTELQAICKADAYRSSLSVDRYKGMILCEKHKSLSQTFVEVAG